MTQRDIAVIGAGWAGCTAAITLAAHGHRVHLIEAARQPGGRARNLPHTPDGSDLPVLLDNGQHILLGAYGHTLLLLDHLGIREEDVLLRLPLQMPYPADDGGMDFTATAMPSPLHVTLGLLRTKGLSATDKIAMARMMVSLRLSGWQLPQDCTVSTLLLRHAQTVDLVQLIWRPLCIAALNTPVEQASAQVFINVLRDSIGATRRASDMLLPRTGLGSLLPERAQEYVLQQGGTVRNSASVRSLARAGNQWQLLLRDEQVVSADAVVVATSAEAAATLLSPMMDTAALTQFQYEPITTCYLQYAPGTRLPRPFYALREDAASASYGQFVFDRGQLIVRGAGEASQDGLLAVVISTSGRAIADGHEQLASTVAKQLARSLRMPQLAQPLWHKTVSDKRATFACTPGLVRPGNTTPLPHLVIAGDYTASDYPATLETAVQSGETAANTLLARLA